MNNLALRSNWQLAHYFYYLRSESAQNVIHLVEEDAGEINYKDFDAVEDIAVEDSAIEDSAVEDSAIEDSAVEDCSRRQCNRRQCSRRQCNRRQCSRRLQ